MSPRPPTDAPMTQLERADHMRFKLQRLTPELHVIKDTLGRILDEAQNPPAEGGTSDGTITGVQYRQLRAIEKDLRNLLVASLFNSR